MPTAVTFGEIMLRLAPPGNLRFVQTDTYVATFGGGEANVAVSLAQFGCESRYVTLLPDNDIAQSCLNSLRRYGVDTRFVKRQGKRIGIYYLETGATQRASKVTYDRAGSSIAEVKSGDLDWDAIFAGADWFHWTGITPAISEGAAAVCLEAAQQAKAKGLMVSCDLNYRGKLWKWGRPAGDVMAELVPLCDVAVGNEEDAERVFGIAAPGVDVEGGKVEAAAYRPVAEQLMARFPNLKYVAITLRGSLSGSHNTWGGILFDGKTLFESPIYDIVPIVDRVGGGDAFCAGLIYSLASGHDPEHAIRFAAAASCLKHSIPGDYNLVSVAEVEALVAGSGSGRVQR